MEVQNTPKRAKSMTKSGNSAIQTRDGNADWDKALAETAKTELILTNGINGTKNGSSVNSSSPEPIHSAVSEVNGVRIPKSRNEVKAGKPAETASTWKLSESIAGRMLNIEPVFTNEEK